MLQRYVGRRCIVTASTQGIGKAIAQRLLLEGGNVIISSRKENNIQTVVDELNKNMENIFEGKDESAVLSFFVENPSCFLSNNNNNKSESYKKGEAKEMMKYLIQKKFITAGRASGCVCHQSKKEDRQRLLNHAVTVFPDFQPHNNNNNNKIDVLVLNAAASTHYGECLSIHEKSIDKMLELNIKSTLQFAQEAKPFIVPHDTNNKFIPFSFSPSILITSSAGAYVPCSPIALYSASKTMLLGLTKSLSENYSHYGVRVNSISPGVTRTQLASLLVEGVEKQINNNNLKNDNEDKCNNEAGGLNSGGFMKRVGEVGEIAAGAAFLCSRDASFITAENLVIAGGGFYHL